MSSNKKFTKIVSASKKQEITSSPKKGFSKAPSSAKSCVNAGKKRTDSQKRSPIAGASSSAARKVSTAVLSAFLIVLLVVMFSLQPETLIALAADSGGQVFNWGNRGGATTTPSAAATVDYFNQNGGGAGTSQSSSNAWVGISKYITATDIENVFDVTLEVQSKMASSQIKSSEDSAICIVMDLSGSMWRCGLCNGGLSGGGYGDTGNETRDTGNHRHNGTCRGNNGSDTAGGFVNDANTRWGMACVAVQRFLEAYRTSAGGYGNGTKRLVSVVGFGSGGEVMRTWIDINASSSNYTSVYNLFNMGNASSGMHNFLRFRYARSQWKGTNMDLGLMLARNLYIHTASGYGSNTPYSGYKSITNSNVLLLSDGESNYHMNNSDSTSTGAIAHNDSRVRDGKREDWTKDRATELKNGNKFNNQKCTVYTVAYGGDGSGASTNVTSLGTWLARDIATSSSTAWTVTTIGNLAGIAANVSSFITRADLWNVTDPMGSLIAWEGFRPNISGTGSGALNSAGASFSTSSGGQLTWDLKKATPVSPSGASWTVFRLQYRVRLNNLDSNWNGLKLPAARPANASANTVYVTNNNTSSKKATLSYVILSDGISGTRRTVDFKVPSVFGYAADFSFVKQDSATSAKLQGAEFSLRRVTKEGTRIDLSDYTTVAYKTGKSAATTGLVDFGALPSGHSYILEETKAPNGYILPAVTKYLIRVEYGVVSLVTTGGALSVTGSAWTLENETRTINIDVRKTWTGDSDNAYGTRPSDNITVELMRDGDPIPVSDGGPKHATFSASDNWAAHRFSSLPSHDPSTGLAYKYSIKEYMPAGYAASFDPPQYSYSTGPNGLAVSITMTNSLKPDALKEVYVKKEWKGETQPEGSGIQPASVIVELWRSSDAGAEEPGDGKTWEYIRQAALSGPNWEYTFRNLPKQVGVQTTGATPNANIKDYTYYVKEQPIYLPNKNYEYTTSVSAPTTATVGGLETTSFTISNTLTKSSVDFLGMKKWDKESEDKHFGIVVRPSSVILTLWAKSYDDDDNVITTKVAEMTLEKDNFKPGLIAPSANDWPFHFTGGADGDGPGGYQKYDDKGRLIEYYIVEKLVRAGLISGTDPALYTTTYDGNIITNTLNAKIVTGNKRWVDDDDADDLRPSPLPKAGSGHVPKDTLEDDSYSMTVLLYSQKKDGSDKTLVSDRPEWVGTNTSTWTYIFSEVPTLPATHEYIVEERISKDLAEVYSLTAGIDADDSVYFINTLNPGEINLTVEKVWEGDDNNAWNTRPANVEITLYKNGLPHITAPSSPVTVNPITLNGSESTPWNYSFSGLPKYESGQRINYSVRENTTIDSKFAYYETSVNYVYNESTNTGTFYVRNILKPDVVSHPQIVKDGNKGDKLNSVAETKPIKAGETVHYTLTVINNSAMHDIPWYETTVTDLFLREATGITVQSNLNPLKVFSESNLNRDTGTLELGTLLAGETVTIGYDVKLEKLGHNPNVAILRAYNVEFESGLPVVPPHEDSDDWHVYVDQAFKDIPFEKVWDDGGWSKRPSSVIVELWANGTVELVNLNGDGVMVHVWNPVPKSVGSKTLNASSFPGSSVWTGTFTDVPVYDPNGVPIIYTVKEVLPALSPPPGSYSDYYVTDIAEKVISSKPGFSITNSAKPDITKNGDKTSVISGQMVYYTLVVRNTSSRTWYNATVNDAHFARALSGVWRCNPPIGTARPLPVELLAVTQGFVEQGPPVVKNYMVSLGNLAPGEVVYITYEVIFRDSDVAGSPVVNTAELIAYESEGGREHRDRDKHSVAISPNDKPKITKTAAPRTGTVTQTVTYTVVVSNNSAGSVTWPNASVYDEMLKNAVAGSVTVGGTAVMEYPTRPSPTASPAPVPPYLIKDSGMLVLGSFAAGASYTLQYKVTYNNPGRFPNTATLTVIGSDDEPYSVSDDDEVVFEGTTPYLTKEASPRKGLAGSTVRYTVIITNPAVTGETRTDVKVQDDMLKSGNSKYTVVAVEVDGAEVAWDSTSGTVVISTAEKPMQPGDVVELTYYIKFNTVSAGEVNGVYHNIANLLVGGSNVSRDDDDVEIVDVRPVITKEANIIKAPIGSTIRYTVTVYNPPNSVTWTNATVTDELFLEAVGGVVRKIGIAPPAAAQDVTVPVNAEISLGSLAPGTEIRLEYDVKYMSSGLKPNKAELYAKYGAVEHEAEDEALVEIEAAHPIIIKDADPKVEYVGGTIEYTLSVENHDDTSSWYLASVHDTMWEEDLLREEWKLAGPVTVTRYPSGGPAGTPATHTPDADGYITIGELEPGETVKFVYNVIFYEADEYPNTSTLSANTKSTGDGESCLEEDDDTVKIIEEDEEPPATEEPGVTESPSPTYRPYIPPPRPAPPSESPSVSPSDPPSETPETEDPEPSSVLDASYDPPEDPPEDDPEPEDPDPTFVKQTVYTPPDDPDDPPPDDPEPAPPPEPTPPPPGNVIQDGDDWIELDEDGVPLGKWVWDPETETWVFEPFSPPLSLAAFPQTGAPNQHAFMLPLGAALIWIGIMVLRLTERRRVWDKLMQGIQFA